MQWFKSLKTLGIYFSIRYKTQKYNFSFLNGYKNTKNQSYNRNIYVIRRI